eukprot:970544-Pelagomonas_calceolata.AAC.3
MSCTSAHAGPQGGKAPQSYASGEHLKRYNKEGPTPTATRARTGLPSPPGQGHVFSSASHFNHRAILEDLGGDLGGDTLA